MYKVSHKYTKSLNSVDKRYQRNYLLLTKNYNYIDCN